MLKKIERAIKKNKKMLVITILAILAILLLLIGATTKIIQTIKNRKAENLQEITYSIYKVDGNNADTTVTFYNEKGIDTITYKNDKNEEDIILNCYGKTKVAIDYKMQDLNKYEFKTTYKDKQEKTLTIDFEIPRIQGLYTLKNGIYVNEPDVSTGLIKENTRYVYLDDDGKLIPGNWLVGNAPEDWYDYSKQKWANIYVESEGVDSYYVWIPRYCYKIDKENLVSGNERTDIKFINVYNEYIDGVTGEKTTWEELKNEGYQIPEAFSFGSQFGEHSLTDNLETIIPGYWISKYQLEELENYIVDYSAIANLTSIEITNIKLNTTKTAYEYIYALDGIEYKREKVTNSNGYVFENIPEGNKTINLTVLDENGEIIGSMTRKIEIAKANEPDLSAFDPNTTFYVYWDENENEHNEIPISMEAPEKWYNYTTANWANIVTRNDGLETYYVWIPRYQYKVNNINQRTYIKFIEGTSTQVDSEYQIPEAFWWDNNGDGVQEEGEQLTGYWMSKYQLTSEDTNPRIDAEMSAGDNFIRIKDIIGTVLTTKNESGNIVDVPLKYEYYINGTKVHEGTNSIENYIYKDLNVNTTYTINIIARNSDTDEYVGAITKKIKTIELETTDT